MEELFAQIPDSIREQVKFVFDMAMLQPTLKDAVHVLNEYTNTCVDAEEKEFTEFYFNLRMEQLKNGNNSIRG